MLAVPPPMLAAAFDEARRAEEFFVYDRGKHQLYEAVTALVQMGWACQPPSHSPAGDGFDCPGPARAFTHP